MAPEVTVCGVGPAGLAAAADRKAETRQGETE